eukprot:1313778-Amphidinium_carterae.1
MLPGMLVQQMIPARSESNTTAFQVCRLSRPDTAPSQKQQQMKYVKFTGQVFKLAQVGGAAYCMVSAVDCRSSTSHTKLLQLA